MAEPLEIWAVLDHEGHVLGALDSREQAEKQAAYCTKMKPTAPACTCCRYALAESRGRQQKQLDDSARSPRSHPHSETMTTDDSQRERLRAARLRSGLSLGTAAELLGMSRKHLGDLEHGRADATAKGWDRILSLLEMARDTGNA